jgi:hypothetical protein
MHLTAEEARSLTNTTGYKELAIVLADIHSTAVAGGSKWVVNTTNPTSLITSLRDLGYNVSTLLRDTIVISW